MFDCVIQFLPSKFRSAIALFYIVCGDPMNELIHKVIITYGTPGIVWVCFYGIIIYHVTFIRFISIKLLFHYVLLFSYYVVCAFIMSCTFSFYFYFKLCFFIIWHIFFIMYYAVFILYCRLFIMP